MTTFRDWLLNKYDLEELTRLSTNGPEDCFTGMVWHEETAELYNKYHEEMWLLLNADAEEPHKPLRTLEFYYDIFDDATLKNAIVWYCAKSIATEIVDAYNQKG